MSEDEQRQALVRPTFLQSPPDATVLRKLETSTSIEVRSTVFK
jgi:hypothetical protein